MTISRYLIVEGEFDKLLLSKILPEHVIDRAQFVVGNGFSSAISLAKSMIFQVEQNLYLFLDTDTDDENKIYDKKKDLMNIFINNNYRNKINFIYIKPEIEILIIENKEVLNEIFNYKYTDDNIINYKRPRNILKEINNDYQKIISNKLTNDIIENIRKTNAYKEILKQIKI